MLSSSIEDSELIQKAFTSDSCFRIVDPLGFAASIANALAGNAQTFLGFCNYQPHKIIEKIIPEMSPKDFTNEEGSFIIGGSGMTKHINNLIGSGIDLLFLKEKKYQYQREFRFVWTVNTKFFNISEYIDLHCKEAVQYCARMEE